MRKFREIFSLLLTHLICGGGLLVTSITALCLSLVVFGCGVILASFVQKTHIQLAESTVVSQILPRFSRAQNPRPEKTIAFLSYINALAPTILNMELLPETQLAAFDPLYEAAHTLEITLQAFYFDEESGKITVICESPNKEIFQNFADAVSICKYFTDVKLDANALSFLFKKG